ncbi:mitotic interactor and substrate of PLK1 isoform X2 [Triplophysa rosa]|uniref:Mitotic interactor and substrate of PLK1 n=2 Tax=Triplophysa rosa TaxID=992332 RepID=A0A9W7TEK3_TRIRA|nr:mitotic interactor and substrate of PLK1 isoform X2 [Triplophysa rosa]XP_057217823.1 mitotic interactor and substrate of PLK1 isoform X2 [Triplophysa rosa]KAI7795509.1 putative mitotic interactor and substrate of PLK1 [Triplophysa rosa]
MTSTPKHWVIKPFYPKLEQTDFRSILSPTGQIQSPDPWSSIRDRDSLKFSFESVSVTGMQPTVMVSYRSEENTPDVVVQAQQVAVSEDGSGSEDWRPSNPSSPGTPSSSGSHVGFYSFVENLASPEAEMNEAYMLSPERQAKLNTLKEKSAFRLQTYVEERRPGRLFEESNDDEPYHVEGFSNGNEVEANPDRMEIIRNQAPRKNPVLKEQWSSLENLDLSNTPQRLMDGFSLRYSPVSSKAEEVKVEPGTIDNMQIDFNAARQQFLMMEESKQKSPSQSPQQLPYSAKLRGRTLSPKASIFPSKQVSQENSLRENQIQLRTQLETKIKTVSLTEDPEDEVQSNARDDVDSGPGDRSAGYVSDGNISNDPSVSEKGSNFSTHNAGETPIEREIRINQEREENLRRSRGILRADSSEMVEIRTKPIRMYLSPQIKPTKAKDTNRVSFLIQRGFECEKRQQSQNRLSSLYIQEQAEVKEKSKAYESQPDKGAITSLRTNPKETPTNEERMSSVEDPAHEKKSDLSDSEEVLSPCCPHRHPDESTIQRNYTESKTFEYQDGKADIIERPVENISSKVRLYKDNIFETQSSTLKTKTEPFWIAENGTSMPWKNRLSSLNILSQSEPKKYSRYTPTWRSHLKHTTWSPQLLNAPDSIREEIEQDLKREQELQELRESGTKSFSTNRDMGSSKNAKNLELTSTEPTYPPTSGEEMVFSPQTSQKHLIEVDHYSWSQDTSVSRLSIQDKGTQLSSPRLSSRLPSVSMMSPQPWGSTNPVSPTVSRVTPTKPSSPQADVSSPLSQKGLTETLLKDFKDRRVKLQLEESAYAGIQPIDDINNEVVEATRVTRHKNQRALQWEAGMYANQEA